MMPELRPEASALVQKVKTFIKDEVMPKEHLFHEQIKVGEDRWNSYPEVIDILKDINTNIMAVVETHLLLHSQLQMIIQ